MRELHRTCLTPRRGADTPPGHRSIRRPATAAMKALKSKTEDLQT
jgi:hypothetical protein